TYHLARRQTTTVARCVNARSTGRLQPGGGLTPGPPRAYFFRCAVAPFHFTSEAVMSLRRWAAAVLLSLLGPALTGGASALAAQAAAPLDSTVLAGFRWRNV